MGHHWGIIGETGLRFFGKMSTSISHDIKNVLAIINENAGLLEDITLMEAKGIPVDPERIKTIAGKIKRQIQRADKIVKNMNRFAHSVDETLGNIDLGELLALVAALSERFASMRCVTLRPEPLSGPVIMKGNPFLLENLVWRCLDFAMDRAGEGKIIGLVAEKVEKGVRIRFTGLAGLSEGSRTGFPAEREKALFALLKADFKADEVAGELVVTLPAEGGR